MAKIKISCIVDLEISWKHVVIGFYENSKFLNAMDILISFVALKIYKYKMKCILPI